MVANEALGRPERWTRRRRLGRAGACGNATGRLNRHCQCEFEPATHPAQRPLLPGPPQGRLVQDGRWSPARSLWVAGLDSESVAQSGWAKATRGSNPEVCCVHAVHKAALGPHLAPVPSAVEADSTNANASANARSPAPTPDRRRHVPKSESFLHHLRDRAGIVSCRSSAGEVPLWGPQTGTRLRPSSGNVPVTGTPPEA